MSKERKPKGVTVLAKISPRPRTFYSSTHKFRRVWNVETDHFKCPRCGELIAVSVTYNAGGIFRSTVCPYCGGNICLQFHKNGCESCVRRTVDCLLKTTVKVEIIDFPRRDLLFFISQGVAPLRMKEEARRQREQYPLPQWDE